MVKNGKSKLWCCKNILNSHSAIIQERSTTHTYSDASSYGWAVSCNFQKCRGPFSTTEKEIHINILELKTALFGMKSFYKETTEQYILFNIYSIDNTSAIWVARSQLKWIT